MLTGSSTYESRGSSTCPGYAIWGQGAMSYDLDGRQSNESLNVSSSYSGCGVSISSVNSRAYDAEGHVTQDVCANAGTGSGVSIPACSPNSNFGGTTASLAWGPTGKLRTATYISACDVNAMTIHWDGDRPLFITDSTGALVQLSVETLGGTFYACQSLAYFVVLDRDFSGTQVSAHNSNGDDDPWEYGQLYSHVIGKGAVVESGGWVNGDDLVNGNGVNSIDNLVLAPTREDGYAVRGLTIQGVRSYDSNTEQWTTPDAYKGDVHDPMSQRSYMWNNNNPVAYSDPSGYCLEDACVGETIAAAAVVEGGLEGGAALAGAAGDAELAGALARAAGGIQRAEGALQKAGQEGLTKLARTPTAGQIRSAAQTIAQGTKSTVRMINSTVKTIDDHIQKLDKFASQGSPDVYRDVDAIKRRKRLESGC